MSKSFNRLLLVFACLFAMGPATFLPSLSAHAPTFSAERPTPPASPALADVVRLSPFAAMSIKVKDPGTVAAKWKTRAGAAAPDYTAGVQNAGADWEARSAAAEGVYQQAVTQAASTGQYGKGVRGSAGKYSKNASTLGPQRFTTGVQAAQDTMAAAIAPVLQTIAGLTLPPRGVKGTNQERSNIVATALRKMKVGS